MSTYRPGRVDLTKEAVDWLKLFHQQNEKHLANLQVNPAVLILHKNRYYSGGRINLASLTPEVFLMLLEMYKHSIQIR